MRIIGIIAVALVALGLLIIIAMNWQGDVQAYETYTNEQYGYQVDYPASFSMQGPSAVGDGQMFTDGDATLTVFGIEPAADVTLRAVAEQYLGASAVEAEVVADTATHATVRVTMNETVYIAHAIELSGGAVGILTLTHPVGMFDAETIDTILASFARTGTGDDDAADDVPTGYRLYESPELAFNMLVPNDASTSLVGSERVEITFLGPDAAEATEINDGFLVTVFRDELDSTYDSVQAYAEAVREDTDTQNETTVTGDLTPRTVNGMQSYRFSYTGGLGNEITKYVFLGAAGTVGFQVSYTISDPADRGYEGAVRTMLESFSFEGGVADSAPVYESVEVALLDTTGEATGEERGCDVVVMVNEPVQPTTAPLSAALERLFSIDSEAYQDYFNFIARTHDTLSFDRAVVEDGTAHIYLTGELSGLAGVCDNPRAAIQIEETALQFETVDTVQLYLNGTATDLQPDGRGTDA